MPKVVVPPAEEAFVRVVAQKVATTNDTPRAISTATSFIEMFLILIIFSSVATNQMGPAQVRDPLKKSKRLVFSFSLNSRHDHEIPSERPLEEVTAEVAIDRRVAVAGDSSPKSSTS